MESETRKLLQFSIWAIFTLVFILSDMGKCSSMSSEEPSNEILSCYWGHLEHANFSASPLANKNCSEGNHRKDVTSSKNLDPSLFNSSNVSHCIIVFRSSSTAGSGDDITLTKNVSPDFWCDYDQQCLKSGLEHDVLSKEKMLYRGVEGYFYCCNTSLCNGQEVISKMMPESSIQCYENSSSGSTSALGTVGCTSGHCFTSWKGGPESGNSPKYGCDTTLQCHSNQLRGSGCIKTKDVELCCCHDDKCNFEGIMPHDFFSTSLSPGTPMVAPSQALNWQMIAGIAGGIIGFALLVVMVIVIIMKYRQRRQDYMSYIYSQLTSDLVDESPTDDDMLEP